MGSTSSDTVITVNDHSIWVARVPACNDAGCRGAAALQFEVEPAPELAPTLTPAPKRPAQPLPVIGFVAGIVVKTDRAPLRLSGNRAAPGNGVHWFPRDSNELDTSAFHAISFLLIGVDTNGMAALQAVAGDAAAGVAVASAGRGASGGPDAVLRLAVVRQTTAKSGTCAHLANAHSMRDN